MKLRELGEFGLVERIRKTALAGKGVRLGIGDDAAWLSWQRRSFLVTSDLLIEGFHFDLKWTCLYGLGYKSLAVNLSDVAAMGGKPSYFLVSLGIPPHFSIEDVQEFFRGLRALSSQCGAFLVGGDTSAADRLLISVCLIGYAPYGAISRTGARVGDDLYVTGTLGDSSLGLEMLKKAQNRRKGFGVTYLISRHEYPVARLQAGVFLAQQKLARAMIDISDGLVQDLGHLCRASGVGAVVWENSLPLSRPYRTCAGTKGTMYALTGGEDYELLFCARSPARKRLENIGTRLGVKVTRIGACVPSGKGIRVLDKRGRALALSSWGYDHFKN